MRVWPSTSWGNFSVGALTMLIGPALVRPVLVGVVRLGYEVKEYADSAWAQAKAEASSIRADATSSRDTEVEVRRLREEVAQLRAKRSPASA